jgi:sigma-B regulation protein RsbU (phosphoserine phosphatase)
MQATLRALVSSHRQVGRSLTLANRLLCASIPEDHFVSLLFAALDQERRRLVYCNAGHPAGLIFDAAGQLRRTLPSRGLPLGLDADQDYDASEAIDLAEGDLVVLYSDGLLHPPEPGTEPFGVEGIGRAVRELHGQPPGKIVGSLYQRMLDHGAPHRPEDDVTAVVIEVQAGCRPGAAAGGSQAGVTDDTLNTS